MRTFHSHVIFHFCVFMWLQALHDVSSAQHLNTSVLFLCRVNKLIITELFSNTLHFNSHPLCLNVLYTVTSLLFVFPNLELRVSKDPLSLLNLSFLRTLLPQPVERADMCSMLLSPAVLNQSGAAPGPSLGHYLNPVTGLMWLLQAPAWCCSLLPNQTSHASLT